MVCFNENQTVEEVHETFSFAGPRAEYHLVVTVAVDLATPQARMMGISSFSAMARDWAMGDHCTWNHSSCHQAPTRRCPWSHHRSEGWMARGEMRPLSREGGTLATMPSRPEIQCSAVSPFLQDGLETLEFVIREAKLAGTRVYLYPEEGEAGSRAWAARGTPRCLQR